MALKALSIFLFLSTIIISQETNACEDADKKVESLDDCIYSTVQENEDCCYVQYTDTSDNEIKQCKLVTIVEGTPSDDIAESQISDKKENTESTVVCPKKGYIPNNCGIVGEGEPSKKELCFAITLPERFCCMLTYTYNGGTYNACRVVKDYVKEGTTKEAKKIVEKYEGAVLDSLACSGSFMKFAVVSVAIWIVTCLF